jgi:hypothetical protein
LTQNRSYCRQYTVNEPKEPVMRGVYKAGPNSLVEKIGQINLREEMACVLGGTGSKMGRRWSKNGNKSGLGMFDQAQAPHRLHCPLYGVILLYLV